MKRMLILMIIGLAVLVVSCGQMRLPFLANADVNAQFIRFPVDLDKLFYDDDPAYYNDYIQYRLLTSGPFISPFSQNKSGHHPEGYGKWYLRYWDRVLAVYLPVRSVLVTDRID